MYSASSSSGSVECCRGIYLSDELVSSGNLSFSWNVVTFSSHKICDDAGDDES
jgi:hypothetical protein